MSFHVRAALAALLLPATAAAKPIAFEDGTTVMAEYGAGTMIEAQAFHAPEYWYSIGAGLLRLEAEDGAFERDLGYARVNYLARRWNRPAAQGNVFAWGSLGGARSEPGANAEPLANLGGQVDYETRRIYGSLRSDWYYAEDFAHRIDTLQFGLAPYLHDWSVLATWFVVQGRNYTGGLYEGLEWAALLRLFKGGAWLEAGVTQDGALQTMLMFNF